MRQRARRRAGRKAEPAQECCTAYVCSLTGTQKSGDIAGGAENRQGAKALSDGGLRSPRPARMLADRAVGEAAAGGIGL